MRLEREGVLPTLDRRSDIRGPDVNDNGVRDDIEAWITALPITDLQKKAAMQTARVQQRSLMGSERQGRGKGAGRCQHGSDGVHG